MNKDIAICYDINTTLVCSHFGETKFFLTADREGHIQVVNNGGNSHHDLIPYLAGLGIKVLICGGLGNHAMEGLLAAGIKVIPGIEGKAEEALQAYLKGNLRGKLSAVGSCSCGH